jgi:hypothetical protein
VDRDNSVEATTLLAGVNATVEIVPNKLNGQISYQVNREEASDHTLDRSTSITDFNLVWQLRKPRVNKPGVSVWLQGQYQDIDDRVDAGASSSPYQVFLGTTIAWPYRYGTGY